MLDEIMYHTRKDSNLLSMVRYLKILRHLKKLEMVVQ